MTLPYTQRILETSDMLFGTGRYGQFWSPDRSLFVVWGIRGDPNSAGYGDNINVWDNATRTRTAYVTGFSDAGTFGKDIEPEAITSDGTIWGTTFANEHALAKMASYSTVSLVSSVPGDIGNNTIMAFACPDGHERLVMAERTTTPQVWLYRPDDDSWEQFDQPTGVAFDDFAYLQDKYGDLWAFAAGGDGTATFWRFKAFGDNPDTIDDVQVVSGLPGYPYDVAFTTGGAILGCDASATGTSGLDRYLVRLSGLDTNSWTVAQTKDFGSGAWLPVRVGVDNQSRTFAPYQPSDTSVWVLDLRDDPTQTFRFATEIQVSDLSELRTANLDDWIPSGDLESFTFVGTVDYETPALIPSFTDGQGTYGDTYEHASISWRYFDGSGDIGDTPGSEGQTVRCWAYTLDGHDFYVMRLGSTETLVYDLTTQQWSSWSSPGRNNWRAHIGQNWQGMTTSLATYPTDVVAGDDTEGLLWILDPTKGVDDNTDTGQTAFSCRVTGGVPFSGRDNARCNAVTLTLSLGQPSLTGASITLSTSDDFGHNWTNHGAVTVAAGAYDATVEWRGLGLMKAPGRVFKFTDSGAVIRISRADIR